MPFYITMLILIIIFITTFVAIKNIKNKNNDYTKISKILTIIYVSLCFINLFLPDAFALRYIWDFEYLKYNHNAFHAIMRTFYAMAIITIPFAIFYKKKNFIRASIYILLPTCLINIIEYKQFIYYYTSPLTEYAKVFGNTLYPFLTNIYFRTILFSIIMSLELILCMYILINNYKELKFESLKDILHFILISLGLYFSNMPIYTLQQLTGTTTSITFNFGDITHILFILLIILEGIILYLLFKKESYKNKYILLLVMSISLLFQYNTFFKTDGIITATRYPLQLCNISGALLIVTLLTKNEHLFHFTAAVNVAGAIIAIILCDSTKDVGILYCMNIHYMVEHANVLLTPILALLLHIFKSLTKKDIKDVIIGFSIYFLFVFIVGTILNGIELMTENTYFDCNYLFMFDKSAATRLVGNWVGILFDIKITLFKYFNIYLVQILVYIVFLCICSFIFYVLYYIFEKGKKGKVNI